MEQIAQICLAVIELKSHYGPAVHRQRDASDVIRRRRAEINRRPADSLRLAMHRIWMHERNFAFRDGSLSSTLRDISLKIQPGAMAFTRTPFAASCPRENQREQYRSV